MNRQYVTQLGHVKHFPRLDPARLAAAFAAKRRPAPRPAPRELPAALSPEECRRCGIPGRKGCAHQAPYVAPPITVSRSSASHKYGENPNG